MKCPDNKSAFGLQMPHQLQLPYTLHQPCNVESAFVWMSCLKTQPLLLLSADNTLHSVFCCYSHVIVIQPNCAFNFNVCLPNIAVTHVLQAVAQTANIEKGNVQLTKAIKLSTSARKYTAVLMVVASLLVLGFDWYAS